MFGNSRKDLANSLLQQKHSVSTMGYSEYLQTTFLATGPNLIANSVAANNTLQSLLMTKSPESPTPVFAVSNLRPPHAPNLFSNSGVTKVPTFVFQSHDDQEKVQLKRKMRESDTEIITSCKTSALTEVQKRRKSCREKEKRKEISDLFEELEKRLLLLGEVEKKTNAKTHRLAMLEKLLELLKSNKIKVEVEASVVSELAKVLSKSIELEEQTKKYIEATKGFSMGSEKEVELERKRIKSMNEKKRRDRVKLLLSGIAVLLGKDSESDTVDILEAVLSRMQ